ncbi:MAG: hypothetical protein LC781_07500 [Actinobacteria bacterium]|nr:hypothetical protein [Actinomycetota bacterium]
MNGGTSRGRNARVLKGLSLLYLGLVVAALLLVHGESYRPPVSYVPLYLIFSVIFTEAVALLLLPTRQFGEGFCAVFYVLYAVFLAAAAFFTGGVSSELYVLFFPLILAPALHGSRRVGLLAQGAALVSYFLAMLPDTLEGVENTDRPALVFFRLAAFLLMGVFAFAAGGRSVAAGGEEGYAPDEDGSELLLGRVSGELEARRGVQVGVILVDPGRRVEDLNLLMQRVRARIGEPIMLGEGAVFGVVLGGVDDQTLESAARRALATASSLGAEETRAGGAIYPRDARSANDLLVAAGRALEAAFEIESPSAIVLAGRGIPGTGSSMGAAR